MHSKSVLMKEMYYKIIMKNSSFQWNKDLAYIISPLNIPRIILFTEMKLLTFFSNHLFLNVFLCACFVLKNNFNHLKEGL